ncbi:hypothetical protein [Cecembia lonarensis]|uniref:Uncharacterized protein n=1 Tax=Cecembia lonarensis (strain CCUG 58316 / KCTC 22772 / LW9) TaxID=1225176 RepID=K1L5P6_CECL9|nr:hypothetical protein [Cecembia lonarensis]EKB50091.1 hypothetical protein B879_01234 [Cecembia lonarensis LW9]
MAKKPKKEETPKVHKDLEGFKMNIDSFGEISSTFSIDKLNEFLNKNVEDKKLKDREDIDEIKDKKEKNNKQKPATVPAFCVYIKN